MSLQIQTAINNLQIQMQNRLNMVDNRINAVERQVQDVRFTLQAAGITSVIWATGFKYDYSWIKLPLTGGRGYPVQRRGVTAWPGLYFTGLQWMYSAKSAQFIGVSEDAQHVAEQLAERALRR